MNEFSYVNNVAMFSLGPTVLIINMSSSLFAEAEIREEQYFCQTKTKTKQFTAFYFNKALYDIRLPK